MGPGEPVDVELVDDGLSTSLRKLLQHPLATDVLDEDILPASLAPEITTELLRERLGFRGLVVTDASLMAAPAPRRRTCWSSCH